MEICKICNYNSSKKINFNKHCKTKSHLYNEKIIKECIICNTSYKSLNAYNNHKRNIHSKYINRIKNNKINFDNDCNNNCEENNNLCIVKSSDIDEIKENIKDVKESNKQVITVVNKAITKASTLIKYLMDHHQSVPPLKKINYNQCLNMLRIDFNCSEDNNDKYCLEKKLIDQYKYGIFIEKLSKSILKFINHHDRKNQSIYNTDVTRNNYVVKTGACEWNEDIAGKRFCNYIIKPLLNAIKNLITNYRENDVEKINIDSEINFQKHFNYLKIILAFEGDLINGKILKPLLKELSPYLRYISEELENLEKMDELEKLQENLLDIINSNTQSGDNNSDSDN